MLSNWSDPRLGEFKVSEFIDDEWETVVVAPAFDNFNYRWNKRPDPTYKRPDSRYALEIDNQKGTIDRAAAADLAAKVLRNQAALVDAATQALWDDINDRGPKSGMWWHGDFSFPQGDETGTKGSFICDALQRYGFTLDGPEGLKHLLALTSIVVRNDVEGYEGHIVELRFDSLLDLEHGIGILTDGDCILGTGYQLDVSLFRQS